MSILTANTKGPKKPECDKRHKCIILVCADAEGPTAKKATENAMKEMRTKRTELYTALKKGTQCPVNCRPGTWDPKKELQKKINNSIITSKKPKRYYSMVWGTLETALECPPVKKKKEKEKKKKKKK